VADYLFTALLMLHPVPEGVIFRSLEMVVRSDVIEIRYQLGLNDAMIRSELRRLEGPTADLPEDAVEALARYRDRVYREVPRGLTATLNQRPVALRPVRADIVRQQHSQIELVFQIPLESDTRSTRFELTDENFSGVPGYHLAALRTRGPWQIAQDGPRQLPQRIPNLPEAGMPGWIPPAPLRRVDAVLSRSAADSTDSNVEPPIAESAVVTPDQPTGASELTDDAPARDATDSSTETDPADLERMPSWAWSAGFATLAVLIACLWIWNARQGTTARPDSQASNPE
jgi:hypothetical protein